MTDRVTFHPRDRGEWRSWLEANFLTAREIWLVIPGRASGESGVPYSDAVEEALCFGWIDSAAGSLDPAHQLRRFTPRRRGSAYSQLNIERLRWLDERGMIHSSVRPQVEAAISSVFEYPEDILDAIKSDGAAWAFYQAFPEPYRRIRVAHIEAARGRPEEFDRRLRAFIAKTRENKAISGYGGAEKYYERAET